MQIFPKNYQAQQTEKIASTNPRTKQMQTNTVKMPGPFLFVVPGALSFLQVDLQVEFLFVKQHVKMLQE